MAFCVFTEIHTRCICRLWLARRFQVIQHTFLCLIFRFSQWNYGEGWIIFFHAGVRWDETTRHETHLCHDTFKCQDICDIYWHLWYFKSSCVNKIMIGLVWSFDSGITSRTFSTSRGGGGLVQRFTCFAQMQTSIELAIWFADWSLFTSHLVSDVCSKVLCVWDLQNALSTTSF